MKTLTFSAKFNAKSTHWVQVFIHPTQRALHLDRVKFHGGKKSEPMGEACCWQANKPAKDSMIGEIHLSRQHLTLDCIVHECSHAAYLWAVLIGIPKDADCFQEYLAGDTGELSEVIIAFLDKKRVPVHYRLIPKRRAI